MDLVKKTASIGPNNLKTTRLSKKAAFVICSTICAEVNY